jgi:hypothetical protein
VARIVGRLAPAVALVVRRRRLAACGRCGTRRCEAGLTDANEEFRAAAAVAIECAKTTRNCATLLEQLDAPPAPAPDADEE